MSDPLNYPKLRWPIDLRLERIEDQEVLIITCPLGISENPLVLISAAAPIISCFEGNLSVDEITEKFREFGLQREHVVQIVNLLDENLFMASPRFFSAQNQIEEDFRNSSLRKSALGSTGYAGTREDLASEIERYLVQNRVQVDVPGGSLAGLVAPHRDYRRGSRVYGAAYNFLEPIEGALYVLLGTAHQYSRRLFHLTLKDFETPLGVAECDRDFVRQLATLYGWERSFGDELLHKREHSLELQLPFLMYRQPGPRIVPILIGSFHEMLQTGRSPESCEEYETFAAALAQCVNEERKKGTAVRILAAVDFAHVGSHFGDSRPMSGELLKEVESRDRQLIDLLAAQDKKGLFEHIAEDQDARRVCGFPSLYTFVDLFDRTGIRYAPALFSYEQAADWTNDRCVTYSGMGFYARV